MDTKKFNVNRIWKPSITPINEALFTKEELQVYNQMQNNRPVQVLLACGPFTPNNELSYDALKDIVSVVVREQPQAMILSGPFVSHHNEDVASGDLRYREPETGELRFLTYDDLLAEIMILIKKQLGKDPKTKIVIIPSTNEISHIYPLPQPPMHEQFQGYNLEQMKTTLMPNPATFTINGISIGFINTDVLKDMCQNIVVKNPKQEDAQQKPKNKIELVLQTLLQQKSYYPMYPSSYQTPVEWEQFRGLMFTKTPDVLITPSDLVHFIKVSLPHFSLILSYRTSKDASVSTPARSSRAPQLGSMHL